MAAEHAAAFGEDLRGVVEHAATLLDALPDEGDARLDGLRERVAESIDAARASIDGMQGEANRASERMTAAIDRWIRDNPWAVVAIGAGVGIAAGVLIARRRGRLARRTENPTPSPPADFHTAESGVTTASPAAEASESPPDAGATSQP